MCGIFGALAPLSTEALDAAAAAIHHRGPDLSRRFVDEHVSLLHARLKIIDLSEAGAQPMASDDGAIRVVFNGEIYNHRALRAELARHTTFRSRSDTEVIVRGYEAWGDRVIEKLDGMFALAIWDGRRRRIVLARDRAGKKPLYYGVGPDRVLRFGSTIGSLRASGLTTEVAPEALPFYLSYGFVPEPLTFYRDVQQLEPGQRLVATTADPGRTRIDTWWSPAFGVQPVTEGYPEATQRVRTLVEAAVQRRLESDVPLGAFLSGGIDSTIVTGVMARALGRVKTFSIGFAGDPRYDETHYARIAARAFGTEHTEFTLEPSSFDLVEALVRHHDGPFGDSSAIPTYVVSQLTRRHVTVALSGDGGDELFCGYQRFLAAEAAERVPVPLRLAARALAAPLRTSSERSLLGRGKRFLDAAALPLADRIARWNSFFPQVRAILRAEVAAGLGASCDAPLAWQRAAFSRGRGQETIARVLEHNFRTYLPCDLLVKSDRCSMAHALELRSPFLDTALIEYASQLPAGYLRRGTNTKRILKEAFADLLPDEIRQRGKMGFGVPLGTWFRGDLRAHLHDLIGPGARLDRYLDRSVVDRMLGEHQRGAADHGQRLWLLLTLEVWLRQMRS